MEFWDTHCHLTEEPLWSDLDQVLERSRGAGVTAIVIPAYDVASWSRVATLVRAMSEREFCPEIFDLYHGRTSVADFIGAPPRALLAPEDRAGHLIRAVTTFLDTWDAYPHLPLETREATARALDPKVLRAASPVTVLTALVAGVTRVLEAERDGTPPSAARAQP